MDLSSLSNIDFNNLNNVEHLRQALTIVLNTVEQQQLEIQRLKQDNQQLKDEINRLKGEQGKPNIQANTTGKNSNISTGGKEKKPGKWGKSPKKPIIPIDKIQISQIDKNTLPPDAVFKGYDELIQQDIIFKRENTLFKLETYYSPSKNKTYRAPIPEGYSGYHADGLKSFALMLKNVCDVTSNKLLLLVRSTGIAISDGALSNILLGYQEKLLPEKNAILKAGLTVSYGQIDGTAARVRGSNHSTQIICNNLFTSFTTLPTKSTLDILAAFQGEHSKGQLHMLYNAETVNLLVQQKISVKDRELVAQIFSKGQIVSYDKFENIIEQQHPALYKKPNMYNRVKESFALSYYHNQEDFPVVRNLVSDNAPEYNKIPIESHALCWVHEARHYKKLSPFIELHRQILNTFIDGFWEYYHELLRFQENPTEQKAIYLENKFDNIFQPNSVYFQLNQRIEKTIENKNKLLVVLKHPEIPLHNNLSELGARLQVRKRDISLHTMTVLGTQLQDAWMTIIQTALKHKIDIFKYIKEFISESNNWESLSDIIYQKADHCFNTS